MHSPTILLDFELRAGWDRSVAQGIIEFGRERDWNIILSSSGVALQEMATTWAASVVVHSSGRPLARVGPLANALSIVVGHDQTGAGVPSIKPDDLAVARLAARHYLQIGLKDTAVFAYSDSDFAIERAAGFRDTVVAGGGVYHPGGEFSSDSSMPNFCSHEAIIAWLKGLPKPCGVFALCDNWAGPVATYCRLLGLRVPEDVALVGVDNDPLVCELSSPPLSSVAIPWREMGRIIVRMIEDHLNGKPVPAECVLVRPLDVVARRSSDTLCVADVNVAEAVTWIRQNAHRSIGVEDVLRTVPTYRQRLERQFRASLGRTVMEEVRRAHVELAKTLLMTTQLSMPEIATRSGFTNATLLGVNFRKELGVTPSQYRRRSHGDAVLVRNRPVEASG